MTNSYFLTIIFYLRRSIMDFNEQPNTTPTLANDGKGFSIAALVLGIVGVVGVIISLLHFAVYVTSACAILGIIFGALGRIKCKAATGRSSGLATAGLVLGIIGTSLSIVGLVCNIACTVAACSVL